MIRCNENCEECRKYTTLHFEYDEKREVEVRKYDCIIAGKTVIKESEELK